MTTKDQNKISSDTSNMAETSQPNSSTVYPAVPEATSEAQPVMPEPPARGTSVRPSVTPLALPVPTGDAGPAVRMPTPTRGSLPGTQPVVYVPRSQTNFPTQITGTVGDPPPYSSVVSISTVEREHFL